VPAAQAQNTAENQKVRRAAVNGENRDQRSKTAETQPVVKSAEHWKREAKTATEPLLLDTAVSRLEPWFKDAKAAKAFRETLFESWQPELVGFYLESLLRYAIVRQVLNGRHPNQGAPIKAKVEALNMFNRLRREAYSSPNS
jgi:hypothetical protein